MRTVGAFLLVTAAVAAGCGSQVATPRAPHRLTRNQLAQYLRSVDVEQQRYERERAKVVGALLAVNTRVQDRTWVGAARELRTARNVYEGLAERMGAIAAPGMLRLQHEGLARSLLLYSEIVDAQQRALSRRDLPLFMRTVAGTQRLADKARVLRAGWRGAALKAARQLDVEFPTRLARIGTLRNGK